MKCTEGEWPVGEIPGAGLLGEENTISTEQNLDFCMTRHPLDENTLVDVHWHFFGALSLSSCLIFLDS